MKRTLLLTLLLSLLSLLLWAQVPVDEDDEGGPTSQPLLRMTGNMHTATLRRIDFDAQGRYIVTCADDKTARLWDARKGQLVRVFRPPIDVGNEGKLYSVAISPDGRFVVAGGWTGYNWVKSHYIYVFNTSTGELVNKVPKLPNVINDLEFSPDGRYVAASLGRDNGVYIIQVSGWKIYKKLTDNGADTYNSAWDKNGRLVTGCNDGYIRLYDRDFELVREVRAKGGTQPYSLAFSPDGSKVAVGYDDTTRIQVLDGKSLALLYEPNVTNATDRQNLEMVAWSRDGRYLYAGGTYSVYTNSAGYSMKRWWKMVRKWSDGGKGSFVDLIATPNTVMDVKVMPDNAMVFAGANPDWGLFTSSGQKNIYNKAELFALNANDRSHLRISRDGTSIGFTPFNDVPYSFDIKRRSFEQKQHEGPSAVTSTEDIEVTDWLNTYQPKLNNRKISMLENSERVLSCSISPDENRIIFGADWNIYCINPKGKTLYKVSIPDLALAVNVAGNGKVFIAAFGDGTVRWYRISDGKELLALYVNSETKKWVLWNPVGYYDCSPGGDSMIGWHVNNGMNRAGDFYSASRFSARYYRPDVIANLIDELDLEDALAKANEDKGQEQVVEQKELSKSLPPVVTIMSPDNDVELQNPNLSVVVQVRSPNNEPITEVKTLINGRPVENNMRGITIQPKNQDGEQRTINVVVPEGTSEIAVMAYSKSGWSEPVNISVNYKPKKEEFVIKPKLYVLAIGVADYDDRNLKLGYAAKDAADFVKALQKQQGSLYREVVVKLLTNKQATKDEILDAFDWIRKETTSKDVAMVFLAGHGVNDQTGNYYFLPVNANLDKIMRTCVPFSDIKNTVASIAGKALFFVDTCHSGNVMGARRGVADITAVVNELSATENGVVVFASSTGSQYSLESPEWGNGAFTKALIEAFSGKADYNQNGRITVNMIDLYVSERVKQLTKGQQMPTTTKPPTVPDFPVIVK